MTTDPQLATQDSSDSRGQLAPVFGIFLNGSQVLMGDSFLGYEYINESKVPQYPMQSGSFYSYNKVATPSDVRVRITKGGSVADRSALLGELQTRAASLDLYDIVTPEQTYRSMNIVKVSHRHSDRDGATMLTLELWFLEIRQNTGTAFTTSDLTGQPVTPVTKAAPGPRNSPTALGVLQSKEVPQTVQDIVNIQLAADRVAMSHAASPGH